MEDGDLKETKTRLKQTKKTLQKLAGYITISGSITLTLVTLGYFTSFTEIIIHGIIGGIVLTFYLFWRFDQNISEKEKLKEKKEKQEIEKRVKKNESLIEKLKEQGVIEE